MTVFARLVFVAVTGCALLFAGCRAPLPGSRQRLQEIRSVEVNRVIAVKDGGRLLLRFRLQGRDAYAKVQLPENGVDGQTAMEFDRDAKQDFAAARKTGHPVPVLGSSTWQAITRAVTGELAPASRREAVLVTAGSLELLICRNPAGQPAFMALTDRPQGMKIVGRVPASQLVPKMTAALEALRPGAGPAVILTGGAPALVMLDPGARRLTFIYAPPEDVLKLPILGASPDATMRGVLSLGVRTGVLGTLRNPVTTVTNAGSNALSSVQALLHGLFVPLPSGPPPPVNNGPPMDIEAWEKRLDRTTGEPRVPASVRLRIDGEAFFPDFIQAIQDARESIDIMLYIFDTDDYAIRIANLLKERSKDVRIRVMIDDVASIQSSGLPPKSPEVPGHRPPYSIVQYLRSGTSIQVRPMAMPALSATHTKMIIIDGGRAWLGGMNIGREYRCDWHDMMVEVTGPLVGWMQRSFARTWAQNGWGGELSVLASRFRTSREASQGIPVPAGAIPVRPLQGSALHSDIKDSQIAALRRAKRSVWIQNAYMADSQYIAELVRARYRGVDVRVILPQDNDSPVMKAHARALVPLLVSRGVRVWLIPEMSHVKAAIYDGWACVGSANFDRISLRMNREFNIGYSDPATVENLRRDLFLKDMARGKEVTTIPESSFFSKVKGKLVRLLAGQL